MIRVADAGSLPSSWVARWAREIVPGGRVLDLAAGAGRNTRLLLDLGFHVDAVDRDISLLATMHSTHLATIQADLESDAWP